MPKDYTYISDFIAEAKLEEAIGEIRKVAYQLKNDDIITAINTLAQRFSTNERQKELGILNNDKYDEKRNQITFALLRLIPELEQQLVPTQNKKSERSTKTHQFNDCKIYECNRSKQCKKFYGKRNISNKVHAFFIHGEENHGHEQLFERFCNELNYRNVSKYTNAKIGKFDIDIPVAPNKHKFKEDLRVALFSNLMSSNAHADRDLPKNIDEAYQTCNTIKKFTKEDIITVKFNIYNPKNIHVIIAGVKYLINDICSASLLAQSAPQFYFFFSIKYSQQQPKSAKERFFAKIQRQKIKLILNLNWKVPVINELTWVREEDIDEWLMGIKIDSEIRQQIISDEFSPLKKSQGYYMRDLVKHFRIIIENYEKYTYEKS